MTLLSQQEIEAAIFEGTYPTKIVKIEDIDSVFVIYDRKIPATVLGWLDFFRDAIYIPGIKDSTIYLQTLPLPAFHFLIRKYKSFYDTWVTSVTTHAPKIVHTNKSRVTWLACKHVNVDQVIPVQDRLNIAQYFWVILCEAEDTNTRNQLILDVFEMVKPWLDKELWQHIQEKEGEGENTRINRLYEEQIAEFENRTVNDDEVIVE